MDLGNKFSYWEFIHDDKSGCMLKVSTSYSNFVGKYFKDVTNGQLVDGLDDFYSDYRNRRILLSNAIWLVSNSIAGEDKKKLEKMIENWRKNPG